MTVVHSNNKYSVIARQQQFTTLRRGYTPENVTEIKVTNFMEDKLNPMFLTATLTWKPAAGKLNIKKRTKFKLKQFDCVKYNFSLIFHNMNMYV